MNKNLERIGVHDGMGDRSPNQLLTKVTANTLNAKKNLFVSDSREAHLLQLSTRCHHTVVRTIQSGMVTERYYGHS